MRSYKPDSKLLKGPELHSCCNLDVCLPNNEVGGFGIVGNLVLNGHSIKN